jgi:hypothetical protein
LASTVSSISLHDSLVYGGNIEASPPVHDAPLGKVVIGESDERTMDPALRDMLGPLGITPVQPLVAIDTTWLNVGHVDELIAFLPDLGTPGRHVLVRASPEVARALIDEASALYLDGLSDLHIDADRAYWRPLTIARHLMNESTHPVTRLFRGKHWLHYHPPRPTDVMPPPHIYRRLVDFYSGLFSEDFAPINPEPNEEADYYPAALSTWDWRYFDRGSNATIIEKRLEPLDQELASAFPGIDIWRVPVVFDRTDDLGLQLTAAFSPNLVNLQFVNGTALIPRPFGPRMQAADAVTVVRAVLTAQGLSRLVGRFTTSFIRREGLAVTEAWINREIGISGHRYSNARALAREFRDGWPKNTKAEDIGQQIVKKNRREFDRRGELRPGWRRIVIPEKTVDLFEAYTHLLLRSLGIRPGWVDSWYYHVRLGEIHCGTNVLRMPPRGVPPWWEPAPN